MTREGEDKGRLLHNFVTDHYLCVHCVNSFVLFSGLSHATGYKWHAKAWKKQITQSPGLHFKKYVQRKEKNKLRQQSMKRKRLFTIKEKHQPDKDYGPNACDPIDISGEELKKQCEARLAEFQKSPQDIASIEITTIGQHENDLYNTYRCDRLTASQFGMVSSQYNNCPRFFSIVCINIAL